MMNWDNLKHSSVPEILEWAAEQPWARAMAECAQDVGWHAEGDVWTHTRLVVNELELLFTAQFLDCKSLAFVSQMDHAGLSWARQLRSLSQ